jgi:hypothetical protein
LGFGLGLGLGLGLGFGFGLALGFGFGFGRVGAALPQLAHEPRAELRALCRGAQSAVQLAEEAHRQLPVGRGRGGSGVPQERGEQMRVEHLVRVRVRVRVRVWVGVRVRVGVGVGVRVVVRVSLASPQP